MELIQSGLVDGIKRQFEGKYHSIPEEYFILIADYIDSISQIDNLYLDPVELGRKLPTILTSIGEKDLGGIHGRTDGDIISMNGRANYETKKLYFFHELTHALQTRKINGHEECCFYNGNSGIFLAKELHNFWQRNYITFQMEMA